MQQQGHWLASGESLSLPAPAKETPLQKYLRQLQTDRYDAIVATIPADVAPLDRYRYNRYAAVAATNLGKAGLARVVWPWQPRPTTRYTRRGAPRVNQEK